MSLDDLKSPWLAAVVMVAVAALGGIGGYMQADKSAEPQIIEAITNAGEDLRKELQEENQRLRDRQDKLRGELKEANDQLKLAQSKAIDDNARMQALMLEVSVTVSTTPRATIRNALTALRELPAWCNEHYPEENTVRMLFVNPAYERQYKKNNLAYQGRTPIEVWGESIGQEYLANDLRIIRDKTFELVTETVSAFGRTFPVEFFKFHLPLPGGVDLACGLQRLTIDEVRSQQITWIREAANDGYYMQVGNG